MPIFFIVGGYANAVSLESARRREAGYADWLAGRLNRLVTPLLALLLGWALLAAILHFWGVGGGVIRLASRAALIPIWFLAIYIMVVVVAPATYIAWRRWGFASFWVFAAVGALVDIAFFRWIFNGWAGVTTSGSGSLFTIWVMRGVTSVWAAPRG